MDLLREITDPEALADAQVRAISSLVSRERLDVARWLRRASVSRVEFSRHDPPGIDLAEVYLTGPPDAIDPLRKLTAGDPNEDNPLQSAFSWLDADVCMVSIDESGTTSPSEGRLQGVLYPGPGPITYNGLRFRSHTEVRVARALDDAGVLFFALPVASRSRTNREPDFVVVHLGRIGVLEIDGPHHTPETRAQEDARAAWYVKSGIRLHRGYSVTQVDADIDGVVRDFLTDLRGPTL